MVTIATILALPALAPFGLFAHGWRLFQKSSLRTKLNIYVFIYILLMKCKIKRLEAHNL
jgi:hypothetical protein